MAHDLTVHDIPVGDLALLPGNPRQGDIGAVSESMRVNGVYQPIIINRGTLTGRPFEVIAGNHRAQAAKQLGHDTIPAVILDVDDEQAARIALADNRTSDLATYDNDALVAMLENLPDLTGTGYDGDDLDDLLSALDTELEDPDAHHQENVGEALAHADALWGEPRHEVHNGDVWELSGRHILVVAQLHDEHQKWTPHLEGRQFYPYPDLFLTLSQHGIDHDMLLVQPNTYLAGHLLDKHTSVHGEDSVTKMEGK